MYNVGSMGSVRKPYPSDYAKVEHQVINHWDCTENRASDISSGRGAAKFREIRKIHKNTKNIAKFGRNLIKYMSVQHTWNLFQLLGLFTCRKLANLSWNFISKTCKQLPGINYVAKNWALAMMLLKGFAIGSFLEYIVVERANDDLC